MRKYFYSIFFCLWCMPFLVTAQVSEQNVSQQRNTQKEAEERQARYMQWRENPKQRIEYELERLKDLRTGKIPDNIREMELKHARTISKQGEKSASGWTQRGPYNIGGRTRALAIDKNNENNILAGGISGGMWRSTDGGSSWNSVSAPAQLQHTVTSIAQDPRVGFRHIWYYTTGELTGNSTGVRGDGVYKSTDNGITWSLLAATSTGIPQTFDSVFDFCMRVVVSPVNGDVYVARYNGIARSTNGGTSWATVLEEGVSGGQSTTTDIAVTASGVFYATINSDGDNNAGEGVFRSPDGTTWTKINPTENNTSFPTSYSRIVIGIAPSNPNVVYFFGEATSAFGYNNTDAGERALFFKYTYVSGTGAGAGGTWTDRSTNLPASSANVAGVNTQGSYNMLCVVHPYLENVVFIGATNLYRSTDGFATTGNTSWVGGYATADDISQYANHHPDNHIVVFYGSDGNKMISGHDGGLSRTYNCLSTVNATTPIVWESINRGYFSTQFYAVAIADIAQDNMIIGGKQDNGTNGTLSTSANDNWGNYGSGDGSFCAIDETRSFAYISSQNAGIARRQLDASGNVTSFTSIKPTGITASGVTSPLFINPFILDNEGANNILYLAGGEKIWRGTANTVTTATWTDMGVTIPTAGKVSALAVQSNILYYGTSGGTRKVLRVNSANGATPVTTDITNGLPSGNVGCIAIDPADVNTVFVVYTNYSMLSIFYTTNANSATPTWKAISGNLEQNADGTGNGQSVRWLAISKTGTKTYYVATSTGVYSTTAIATDGSLTDRSTTAWTKEGSASMGDVVSTMILTRSDGLVVVGTHGRGVFSDYINADAPPRVVNPIADVSVVENAPNTNLDLSNVFQDPDGDAIVLSIQSISNNTIFQGGAAGVSLAGNNLVIDYDNTGKFGSSTITIRATAGGKTTDDTFTVAVGNFCTLFDQTNDNSGSGNRIGSYTDPVTYDTADDFTIPVGEAWTIKSVLANTFTLGGNPTITNVIVKFWNNGSGTPSTVNTSQTVTASAQIIGGTSSSTSIQVVLNSAITLPAGTYWVSLYPAVNNTTATGRIIVYQTNGAGNGQTSTNSGAWAATSSKALAYRILGEATPTAPSGLTATTLASSNQINLSWTDNSSNEAGFEIQRSTVSGSGFVTIATLPANTTTFANTGLSTSTIYFYKVRSIGASCGVASPASAYTSEATATTGTSTLATVAQSLQLDGTGDYLTLGNESYFDFTSAMAVEFWFKSTGTQKTNATLVAKGSSSGWRVQRDGATNDLAFETSGLSTTKVTFPATTTNVFDGGWHHIACTYDGTRTTIFVDGKSNNPTIVTGSITTNNQPVTIGENSESTGRELTGEIDEVKIWSTNRSIAQIRANRHLAHSNPASETGLVAYIKMGASDGTNERDLRSNVTTTLSGNATIGTANTPLGESGVSESQNIQAVGTANFSTTGMSLTFNGSSFPNGTVVVTRINEAPKGTAPAIARLGNYYWIVNNYGDETAFGTAYDMTLSSITVASTDQTTPANVKLFKRADNATGAWTQEDVANAATASTATFAGASTSFSQFVPSSNNAALPITLLNFRGERDNQNRVVLHWTTVSEFNALAFEIEMSADAQTFTYAGKVMANGYSNSPLVYKWIDENAQNQAVYYRLKLVDKDNSFQYSPLLYLPFEWEMPLRVYPNPTSNGNIKLKVTESWQNLTNIYLQVSNIKGTVIWQTQGTIAHIEENIHLALKKAPQGMYFITIHANGVVNRTKIIKQ